MKMIRNGFFKYISIILILLSGVLNSACNMSWFDDLDDGIKTPLFTKFNFYSCAIDDDSGCEYKTVEKLFLIGTIASSMDFPYIDLCGCKPGYRIVGWQYYGSPKLDTIMTDDSGLVQGVFVNFQIYSFIAKWRLIEDVEYTVKYYFQNPVDKSVYEEDESLSYKDKGQVDSRTNAVDINNDDEKKKDHYYLKKPLEEQQEIILEDGSTVVCIYYDYTDSFYTVRHLCDDEDYPDKQFDEEKTYWKKKGTYTDAEPLSRDGYEPEDFEQVIIADDNSTVLTIKYHWVIRPYTVNHYLQNSVSGEYELSDTKTEYGTRNALTDAKAFSVEDGTLDPHYEVKAFDQQTIKEDGSTVVSIYYEYINAKYVVKHHEQNRDSGEYDTIIEKELYGRKGAVTEAVCLTVEDDGLDSHYEVQTFDQQTIKEDGSTVVDIYYKWKYKYTVKYLLESETEDDYSIEFYTDESKTCYYGEQTEAEDLSDEEWNYIKYNYSYYYREGFELLDIVQQVPASDDSTVIEVKYKRKVITVNFYDGVNSEPFHTETGKYNTGKSVSITLSPSDVGYTDDYEIDYWTSENVGGYINKYAGGNSFNWINFNNLTFTAHWVKKTDYTYEITIRHWFQQYENGTIENETLRSVITEPVLYGEMNYIKAQSYAKTDINGYSFYSYGYGDLEISSSNVYSYTVDLYYKLISSTVTFDLNDGSTSYNYSGVYTKPINTLDLEVSMTPERDGYKFLGWTKNGGTEYVNPLEEEFDYNPVTYTAQWQALPVNPGIVINPPDVDYTQKDIELPSAEDIVDESTHTLNLSAASGYAQYIWIINAEYIFTSTENHYEWNYSSLPAGVYDILVVVVDSAGNQYGDTVQIEIN